MREDLYLIALSSRLIALSSRNASKTEEAGRQNSLHEAGPRVKEAYLAPPSLTLLLAKQALRWTVPYNGIKP